MEEDKILYEKFLSGDENSFNVIVEKYKNNLMYFITRYVNNIEIAEDIFQDTILYILENKGKYDFKFSLKTYMYMIAKSRSINYINKNDRIQEMPENLADEKLLEEIICQDEQKEKIHNVINKLQKDYQLVIYLTQIEKLTYKETAKIMEKTESQIKTLVHNSKKKLKKLLVKENVVEVKNKRIILLFSTILFIAATITGATYADEIREFVKDLFGANASDGVDTAVNNGFIARPKIEEQTAEGISVAVENFMMDDYNFGMNFIFTFENKDDAEELATKDILLEDLKIVDEENNIVFSTNYDLKDREEVGEEEIYYNGFSMKSNLIEDNKIRVSLITSGGVSPFPRSKKLKITFKRITEEIYPLSEEELQKSERNVYIGDWKFEVDVPEEMYKREVVVYKVKSCNDKDTVVDNATLSNTAFKISIPVTTTDKIDYKALYDRENMKSIYSLIALQKEYVETSDGRRFEASSDGNSGYGGASGENRIFDYHQTFNLTKFDATDILTVHIFTNIGKEIIVEFEKLRAE
ncbi:MAG: sigma-70 family RNA polymerase sigma factor [Clostridia bacterium]|nr:sigma-70 family RNA polymerase sigma factor [Clostridia bacterium]